MLTRSQTKPKDTINKPYPEEKDEDTINDTKSNSNVDTINDTISPFTIEQCQLLHPSDEIDFRDEINTKWYPSRILEKYGDFMKVHFIGWDSKWDIHVNYHAKFFQFAKYGTYTKSKCQSDSFKYLKKNSYLDINPHMYHMISNLSIIDSKTDIDSADISLELYNTVSSVGPWYEGKIIQLCPKSGQVKVSISGIPELKYYWTHLDSSEVQPWRSQIKQ